MRKFREVFLQTLDLVCSQYRGTRLDRVDNRLLLIEKRLGLVDA